MLRLYPLFTGNMTTNALRLAFVLTALTGLSSCATKQTVFFQPSSAQRYYSPQPAAPAEQVVATAPDAAPVSQLMASTNEAIPAIAPGAAVALSVQNEPLSAVAKPVSEPATDNVKILPALTRKEARRHLHATAKAARQQARVSPTDAGETTNGLAIASLVCGILGLLILPVLFGPLAVIFGGVAMSQIRRNGGRGRGMAVAGLVMGIIATVIMLIALGAAAGR